MFYFELSIGLIFQQTLEKYIVLILCNVSFKLEYLCI